MRTRSLWEFVLIRQPKPGLLPSFPCRSFSTRVSDVNRSRIGSKRCLFLAVAIFAYLSQSPFMCRDRSQHFIFIPDDVFPAAAHIGPCPIRYPILVIRGANGKTTSKGKSHLSHGTKITDFVIHQSVLRHLP
jgi:hypothetical protein